MSSVFKYIKNRMHGKVNQLKNKEPAGQDKNSAFTTNNCVQDILGISIP